MIVFLQGVVQRLGIGFMDVNVQGVGYRAHVPDKDLGVLGEGMDVTLFTHHHVREDEESLYGFLDEADKDWFELLLSVSGVGPKVALQIVSAARFDGFAAAVTGEDSAALAKLPGIGRKTADRLIIELRDKLKLTTRSAPPWSARLASVAQPGAGALARRGLSAMAAEVVEALSALGYNERQAMEAIAETPLDDGDISIAEAIRRCLGYFDRSRARSAPR